MRRNLFSQKMEEHPFLIMAHRGFWGGNVIENSIESSWLAYKAGADVVEIDVCRTADGKYYLFHDGNEPKLLNRVENFKVLSSSEVDASDVYNSIGSVSGCKINTLTQLLAWLPQNLLVNLDRSWEYWDDLEFFEILANSGKQDQLVLKSPAEAKYLDFFSENGKGFAYIPIVKSKEECRLVESYTDIHTIGLELIVSDWESELLDRSFLKEKQRDGMLLVANSENLGAGFNLFAGMNDHVALFQEGDWDPFIQAGINVIQTDWPNFLFQYRENLKSSW